MKVRDYKAWGFFMLKAYFDKGYNFLSYAKYPITLLGGASVMANKTALMLYIMLGYGLLCFIVGFIMYHFKYIETEKEIQNRYDPFMIEMREAIKKQNI